MNFENQEPKNEDLQQLEKLLEKSEELSEEDFRWVTEHEAETELGKEIVNAIGLQSTREMQEAHRGLARYEGEERRRRVFSQRDVDFFFSEAAKDIRIAELNSEEKKES